MLDKDGNGYIEEKELAEIIGLNSGNNKDAVKKLISEIDENGDNKIDFNEFKRMLSAMSEKKFIIKN